MEKILTGDEQLPDELARARAPRATTPCGTSTASSSARRAPAGCSPTTGDFVTPQADEGGDWEATVRRAAYKVVTHELAAEVERLVRTAARIARRVPEPARPRALGAAPRPPGALVRLPVYRPYAADPARAGQDAAMLGAAAAGARTAFRVPEEARAVDLVRDLALGRLTDDPGHGGTDCADFAARFAQTASALHAKSVEDTAFYRYPVLLSACEVGGDPGEPALAPEAFHAYCARVQRDWPATGTVLSTHDTKRSADVRARIAVLSECPDRWRDALGAMADGAVCDAEPAGGRSRSGGSDGVVAGLADRVRPGCARRRSRRRSAWRPRSSRPYGRPGCAPRGRSRTRATRRRSRSSYATGRAVRTAAPLAALDAEVAPFVRANVLGAALLHLTMPGVPDLYQGTELDYAALVDPDNRRPPRFRPEQLAELDAGTAPRDLSAEKLRLTATALRLRREHPHWFGATATYEPLYAEGPAAEHCVAFCRGGRVLTVVTRLSLRLVETGGWWDTLLRLPPGGPWHELLTGRELPGGAVVGLSELLAVSPVALFVGE